VPVTCMTLPPLLLLIMLTEFTPSWIRNDWQVGLWAPTTLDSADNKIRETDNPSFEMDLKELFRLTNEERKKAGVPVLATNLKLQAAAIQHAKNMANQETLAHELDEKGPSDRVREQKYEFRALAENIAEGQKTPAEVIKSWMGSEGHRTNLLNPDYTEIGLGIAESAQGTRYWAQVFGKPRK
jgi:uncharacterized protein YkwD